MLNPAPKLNNNLRQLPCAVSLERSLHGLTQSKMLTKCSHTLPWEQKETSTLSIKIIQTHLQQINQKKSTITKHKTQNPTTSIIHYNSIQLRCVDLDIIYNICQHKIQSYWVNISAGTTFCHKTSLLPEFCKAGHVLATVMGMRSHMNKFCLWEVTTICLLLHLQLLMACILMFIPCQTVSENIIYSYKYDWFHEDWY